MERFQFNLVLIERQESVPTYKNKKKKKRRSRRRIH
jgi:hypothetical protein